VPADNISAQYGVTLAWPRDLARSTRAHAVADTGEGIPADELPFVFDRFRRVDPSRSRATGGSGLGLAIVRHIVGSHGGTVAISSRLGEGTEVTLRLPDLGVSEPAASSRG
jgi:two-component system sensor histidine kinase BaeS